MEGLLIAQIHDRLASLLPAERASWRFPDAHTFVLPLGRTNLWIYSRPPHSRIELRSDAPSPTGTRTGFQDALVAHAGGVLERVAQPQLDRVLLLHFAPFEGFVRTERVQLVLELTGRNGNLVLLDDTDSERNGRILAVQREITRDVNRYRELRPSVPYTPPPPYERPDPRTLEDRELRELLAGVRLKDLRQSVDGIGPDLTRALAAASGLPPNTRLDGDALERLVPHLRRLLDDPQAFLDVALDPGSLERLRDEEERNELRSRAQAAVARRKRTLERRLDDITRAREAALDAERIRGDADLLLAYAHDVPANTPRAELMGFDGETVTLELDPKLGPVDNAQAMYERARKRESRAKGAGRNELELLEELESVDALLAQLDGLPDGELEEVARRYEPEERTEARAEAGIPYRSPQGFEVRVGRNSRDNDAITFRVAKSLDVWLHAQGYPGSHVIVRANGREVPFETILYAAQLAAAYSKAAQSDNVPVDYTLRKNVWRPKGAAPGAVHFTQQKTVYVTPSRRPDAD